MHSITSDNDRDYEMITSIQQKLIFDKITPSKSTGEILNGLMHELNQLKAELTGKIYFDFIKIIINYKKYIYKKSKFYSCINDDNTRNESYRFRKWKKESYS